MDQPKNFVGKKGLAEIVKIYAVLTNSDPTEGRGQIIDHSYYKTEEGAKLGSIGAAGWGHQDADIAERLAIRFDDATYFLLNTRTPQVEFVDEERLLKDVRSKALAKLSPNERLALGVQVKK